MSRRITTVARCTLAAAASLLLFHCAVATSTDASGEDDGASAFGRATLEVRAVPADVACLRLRAAGARVVERELDVAPGASVTVAFEGLPLGVLEFDGAAYPHPCATASERPTFVAAKVRALVEATNVTRVLLTMLRDGRAAVEVDFESAEPTATTWTTLGDLPRPRSRHEATLVGDRIVLTGGIGPESARPILLSPDATLAELGPPMPTGARSDHTATLLPSGRVFVAGGTDAGVRRFAAEIFDPATRSWATTAPSPRPHAQHAAVALGDAVLLLGGLDGAAATASVDAYRPNGWAIESSLPSPRYAHTATRLLDGRILVVGGFPTGSFEPLGDALLFEPARGTWSFAAAPPLPRGNHAAVLLPDGRVLTVAGDGPGGRPTARATIYDPTTNTWSDAGQDVVARDKATATLVGGRVWIVGGLTTSGPTDATAIYDVVTGTLRAGPPLARARYGHSATAVGGRVVVVGGEEAIGTPLPSVERSP
jgi:hypothetical protein